MASVHALRSSSAAVTRTEGSKSGQDKSSEPNVVDGREFMSTKVKDVRLFAGAVVAISVWCLFIQAPAVRAQTAPQITSVQLSGSPGNYTVTVNGSGFGSPTVSLPYTGDVSNFRIGDDAQLGHGEWGYSGDANALTYEFWSDSSITVSGFGGQPGDAIVVALWNASLQLGATWGGNVPGGTSTPIVTSVQLVGTGQNLQITVNGSGFGSAPVLMPYSGDLNYFDFGDFRTPCEGSALFSAGFARWGIQTPDAVALNYESWSDTQIVISGFGGGYGSGCATYQAGDPVAISVWNTSDTGLTGPQTAWGGQVGGSEAGSFILAATQSAETVALTGSNTFTITAESENDFSGTVQLEIPNESDLASQGIEAQFSGPLPVQLEVSPNSSPSATLTVTAALGAQHASSWPMFTVNVCGTTASSGTPVCVPLQVSVEKVTGVQNSLSFESLTVSDSTPFCGSRPSGECFSVQQNFFVYTPDDGVYPSYWAQNILVVRHTERKQHHTNVNLWEAKPLFQLFTVDSNGNTSKRPIDCRQRVLGFCTTIPPILTGNWTVIAKDPLPSVVRFSIQTAITPQADSSEDVLSFSTFVGGEPLGAFESTTKLPTGSFVSAGQTLGQPRWEPELALVSVSGGSSPTVVFDAPTSGIVGSQAQLSGGGWVAALEAPFNSNSSCSSTLEASAGLGWSADGASFEGLNACGGELYSGEGVTFVPGVGLTCPVASGGC